MVFKQPFVPRVFDQTQPRQLAKFVYRACKEPFDAESMRIGTQPPPLLVERCNFRLHVAGLWHTYTVARVRPCFGRYKYPLYTWGIQVEKAPDSLSPYVVSGAAISMFDAIMGVAPHRFIEKGRQTPLLLKHLSSGRHGSTLHVLASEIDNQLTTMSHQEQVNGILQMYQ